jgi:hypothetical protein
MKHNLRKFIPLLFLAVISFAVILPSAVLFTPQAVYADAASDAAAAAAAKAAAPAAPAPAAKPAAPAQSVDAGLVGNAVLTAISAIIQFAVNTLGLLTIALIHILLLVAGYNSYMDSPAITTGWVVVRDVANLFFVAIILVVSIGSIVNPEKFGGVKKVFRILLFAILVNFSRTIAGLFIDISQLVMLTFVNGFAQAAGGNFVEALGISKINSISPGSAALNFASMLGAYILALLMMIIITVIIAVLVVALTVRMVTLWMLVVLSPLAFALGASDVTKSHYDEWWKKFSAELTTGPIVAFFLWLSLVSFQNSNGSTIVSKDGLSDKGTAGSENTSVDCGPTDSCSQENLIRFIVASCMLLIGLGFAKEFSGVGGSLAKAAASKGQKYAQGALNYGVKKVAPAAAGFAVGGPIGAGVVLAARSSYGKAAVTRGKALMGQSLAGGNKVGNTLSTVPILGRLTTRVGMAFSSSANKDYAEKTKKADENIKGANPKQLVAMSMGHGVDRATEMAAKVAAASKATKDTGWGDAEKGNALKEAESYYKSTSNKAGLDEIEKQYKKNPLLISKTDMSKNPNDPEGAPLKRADGDPMTKREQVVQKMSSSDLVELDPESIKEIAGYLTPNQRDRIKKDGGKPREDAITEWENRTLKASDVGDDLRTGKLSTDNVSDKILLRPDIAMRVSAGDLSGKFKEILKTPAKKEAIVKGTASALAGMDAKSKGRLVAGGKSYTNDAQSAAEGHVRAGGTIKMAFNIDDKMGKFANAAGTDQGDADEEALKKAIKGDNSSDVLLNIDASAIDNKSSDLRQIVQRELDVKDLFDLRTASVGDAAKRATYEAIARSLLEKYIGDSDRTETINKKLNIY